MDPELSEDARPMMLDRPDRQVQRCGDLSVRVSEGQQASDLDLPRRESAGREHQVDASFGSGALRVERGSPVRDPRGLFGHAFGHPDLDGRSAGSTLNPAPATGDLRPLPPGSEPAMVIRGCPGGLDVEPDPVVLHDDVEPATPVVERY